MEVAAVIIPALITLIKLNSTYVIGPRFGFEFVALVSVTYLKLTKFRCPKRL